MLLFGDLHWFKWEFDVNLFICRFCGDDLPDDIISTGEKLQVRNVIVDSLAVAH